MRKRSSFKTGFHWSRTSSCSHWRLQADELDVVIYSLDKAIRLLPANPIIKSDNPWADARNSSGTDSLSSVEPATIVQDHPHQG